MTTTTEAERLLDQCLMTTYAARSATAAQRAPCYTALLAELRRLAAVEAERNTLAAAIGNQQLAAFIEKHGDPVPIVAERDQERAARQEAQRQLYAERERLYKLVSDEQVKASRLHAEIEALRRGEFICGKCGLRKDAETSGPAPF